MTEEQAADWANAESTEPHCEELAPTENEVPLDCMPMALCEAPINPGLGLGYDSEKKLIGVGIVLEGGSASILISLEDALQFRDNLNSVIAEAEADVIANKDNVEV